ncbi:hypothetical protein ACFOZ5_03565 [Marinobacter lacisalsi]|uniref:Lipoprotein n=1 Tax=Marinobacter lacisalsi TaxID=475979 RepID=A0ABV8QEY5_9GAMM
MKEKDARVPVFFAMALSVAAFSGCDSESQLEADASALCNAFDPEHLRNEYEGMWLSDVEMAVYVSLENTIETEEVQSVIAGRSDIDNYSQVYPSVKEGMEDALAASWDCQNMASFYEISFVPATGREITEPLELRHTTLGDLKKLIALPAQPDSVKWSTEPAVPSTGNSRLTVPGPTDYGLTALLHFSQEDYEDIVRNSERVNEANDVVVNPEFYETWIPEDVKAELETEIHADGESIILVGHPAYKPDLFVNREGGSPLIHGSIQPLGKGYIVVSLYMM